MGKGSRNRELHIAENTATGKPEVKLSKKQLIKKQEKKEKIKKYVTLAAILAIVVAVIVVIVVSAVKKSNAKLDNQIAATSESYEVTNGMLAFLMYNGYQNFLSSASNYVSLIGLDTSKSLKSQSPDPTYFPMLTGETVEAGTTWYDYFLNNAKNTAAYYVAFAAKAEAEGMKLDSDDKADIKAYIKSIKDAAASNGYSSTSSFLSAVYAPGVTEKSIKRVLELELLAEKYSEKLVEDYNFTDEEMNKYLDEHPETFKKADYIYYSYGADVKDDATEEEKTAALNDAKAKAEELLAKFDDAETFKKEIQAIKKAEADETAIEKAVSDAKKKAEEDKLDEEATNKAIEDAKKAAEEANAKNETDYAKNYVIEGGAYVKDGSFTEWAVTGDRKAGDKAVLPNKDSDGNITGYSVFCLTKPMYIDDYASRDVRHILVKTNTGDDVAEADQVTAEQAKAKAEEILAEYKAGELTAEAFGKLADKYSEDPGSNTNGGLYEQFAKGDTYTAEFNDWLFDEARKAGDTAVVETTAGAHVMYYVGENTTVWKLTAEANLKNEKFEEDVEASKKEIPLTFDEEIIANIP